MKRYWVWMLGVGLITGVGALASNNTSQAWIQDDLVPSASPIASVPATPSRALNSRTINATSGGFGVTNVSEVMGAPTVSGYAQAPEPGQVSSTSAGGVGRRYAVQPAMPLAHVVEIQREEQQIQRLLVNYQSEADEAKRKEAVDAINQLVINQFDKKQKARSEELQQLEQRLNELKETHSKRESMKDKIVSDRVQQLLNNADGLGWGNEPGWGLAEGSVNLPYAFPSNLSSGFSAPSQPLPLPPGQALPTAPSIRPSSQLPVLSTGSVPKKSSADEQTTESNPLK